MPIEFLARFLLEYQHLYPDVQRFAREYYDGRLEIDGHWIEVFEELLRGIQGDLSTPHMTKLAQFILLMVIQSTNPETLAHTMRVSLDYRKCLGE